VIDTDDTSLGAQGWLEDVSKVEKYTISEADYNARADSYRKYKAAKVAADPSWTLEKELAIRAGEGGWLVWAAAAVALGWGRVVVGVGFVSTCADRGSSACDEASRRIEFEPTSARRCMPPPTHHPPMQTQGREYAAPKPAAGDDYGEEAAAAIEPGRRCSVDPGDRRGEVRFVGRAEGLAAGYWVGVALDEPVGKNDGSVKGRPLFSCAPGHGVFVRPEKVTVGDYPPLDDFSDLGSDDEI